MAETPDEIQRQIEDTRAELAVTVEQIADRVSPKKVATRGAAAAKDKVEGAFTTVPAGGGSPAPRWDRIGAVAGALVVLLLLRRSGKKRAAAAPRKAALKAALAATALAAKEGRAAERQAPAAAAKGRSAKRAARTTAELQVALDDLQRVLTARQG